MNENKYKKALIVASVIGLSIFILVSTYFIYIDTCIDRMIIQQPI